MALRRRSRGGRRKAPAATGFKTLNYLCRRELFSRRLFGSVQEAAGEKLPPQRANTVLRCNIVPIFLRRHGQSRKQQEHCTRNKYFFHYDAPLTVCNENSIEDSGIAVFEFRRTQPILTLDSVRNERQCVIPVYCNRVTIEFRCIINFQLSS